MYFAFRVSEDDGTVILDIHTSCEEGTDADNVASGENAFRQKG